MSDKDLKKLAKQGDKDALEELEKRKYSAMKDKDLEKLASKGDKRA